MAKPATVQRRRELRSQHTMKVRKTKFIASYIQAKYRTIYAEASEFYNTIDKHYPEKRDLTKTVDYRAWELTTVRETEQSNMEPSSCRVRKPLSPRATATDMRNFQLRIPLLDLMETTDEGTTGPVTQEETTETLDEGTTGPVTQEGTTETLDEGTTGPVTQEGTTETLDEGTTGPVTQEGSLGEIVAQTVGSDQVYPSILDEISPGLLTQLFEELEADPELKQIFQDLEEGLDIGY